MAPDGDPALAAEAGLGQGANFRALMAAAVDGIILIDGSGRILAFNPAAERMFGYRAGEVLGRDVSVLMPATYAEHHQRYMDNYMETGVRRIIGIGREVQARRQDGTVFPIDLSVGEVETGGERRFVGIIRDISARKEAEREVRDLQERLARVARFSTMGEMAAGLAHEINQPLAAISTYAQAGERMIGTDPPPDLGDLREICSKIRQQSERAGEVIRRLRGFLRKQNLERGEVCCNQLIGEVLMLAEVDARAHGIELRTALADDLPPVNVDAVEIQQVVLNLVRNAVDAMSEARLRNGGILIETRALDDDTIEIAVTDHGPGVVGDIARSIFHPFVTSKQGGLGVGLSISRTIVQAHGGRLYFEPNPAGGTVFRFTLPLSYGD
jgi:two-component system sensor kinase FixL